MASAWVRGWRFERPSVRAWRWLKGRVCSSTGDLVSPKEGTGWVVWVRIGAARGVGTPGD
jgi:hypothetical protein